MGIEFNCWFSGLVDGEGHLSVDVRERKKIVLGTEYTMRDYTIFLAIALRHDDISTLEYIQANLNCGHVNKRKYRKESPSNPISFWKVSKIKDIIEKIIPIFETCPLRTKKGIELPLWKRAAEIKLISKALRKQNGTRNGPLLPEYLWKELLTIKSQLSEIRRYK